MFESMNFKKTVWCAVFPFLLASHAQAQTQETMAPPAIADLFIKMLVHTDPVAMQALNDYQRPERRATGNQNDFVDVAQMLETDRIYAEHIAKIFMKKLSLEEADKQVLQPDVVALFQSLRNAQKRTVCQTGDVKPLEGGRYPQIETITVAYTCKAVQPPERITGFLKRSADEKWHTLAAYREGVLALRQGYETAPLTQDFNGRLPLAREVGHQTWQNQFPRESLDISSALY